MILILYNNFSTKHKIFLCKFIIFSILYNFFKVYLKNYNFRDLFMIKKIQNITDESFKKYLSDNEKYLLLDFWATWCAPCQSLSIILKDIYSQYAENLKICKIDIEKNPKLTSKYSIQSIPTLILFKKNKVIDTHVGFLSKDQLQSFLNKYIK